MSGNIKVVCRFRPQNRVENENNGQIVVSFPDEQNVVIEHSKGKNSFAFDRIYDWTASQREVFMYSAKQVVDDVMNGYNGTIFAYGQTGSGKTFTMQGPDIDNPELRGLIPRIVEYIFTSIVNAPSTMEFTVSISYLEIYMEKIRDLLDRRNDNLQIHEEKIKGVYVKGATSVYVSSPEETMQVMKIGTDNRAVSATNMNEESSRSHSVMLLSINQKNVKDGSSKSGKLYLVDLAGSEMVGKTGATGQTLEEAKKINKSLTALGMVINALTDGKSTHVPYRDSKLTRLLQESLGGNSRTTLVINCSPSSYNDAETLSTLRFGMRAKKIENKAKVNQELSSAELRKLLDIARKQFQNLNKVVAAMEKELSIWRTGGKVAETEWVNASQIMEGEKHEREEATPEKPAAATAPAPEKVSSSLEKAAASEKGDDGSSTATELSRSTSISSGMDQEDQEEVEVPEGDLIDQIVQKELLLKTQEDMIDKLQNELERYRGEEINAERFIKENKELNQKLNEATFKFEKQSHEYRELEFGNETLQQTNQSLQEKLTAAEKRVEELELQLKQSETDVRSEKIKAKMAEEMASVNIYTDQINMRENEVRANLVKLNSMDGVPPPSPRESVASTRKFELRISELEELVENLKQENISLVLKQHGLTSKVKTLEEEYENILDEMIAKEEERQYEGAVAADNLHELKIKLEAQFEAKKEAHIKQLEELRIELSKRNDDLEKLRNVVTDQKWSIEHLQTENDTLKSFAAEQETKAKSLMATSQTADEKDKEVEELKKMMNRQLEDFNKMKEHLLKDLQNRCQKVVELEISLDQSRDQYQSVLRSSNNKNQQKKMAVLEKSLEQVSAVHTQLVEQNAQLKREAAMSVRKLEARAERIHNLEILLQDSQERLERQAQKYETEIHALQEKLTFLNKEPRKSVDMSRIAKPIRGGAAIPASPSAQYAFSSVMPSSTASPSHLQKSRSENLSSTSSPSGKPNMFGLLWTTPKKS